MRRSRLAITTAFGSALLWCAVGSVRHLPAQAPSVAIRGDVTQPLTLTAEGLATLPRASVETSNNGISTRYDGVCLSDVLMKAGVPLGPDKRGATLAGYVIASATDGYQVVFSLGELDPGITHGQYLLADKANGQPLFGESGAFRLVIPTDKRGARSLRMLTALQVVQLRRP
jgi:hypothetical protein